MSDDDDEFEKTMIIRPGSADAVKFTPQGDSHASDKTVVIAPAQNPRARAATPPTSKAASPSVDFDITGAHSAPKPAAAPVKQESSAGTTTIVVVLVVVAIVAAVILLLT